MFLLRVCVEKTKIVDRIMMTTTTSPPRIFPRVFMR